MENKPADEETAVTTKSNMKPTINGEPQFSFTYVLALSVILFRPTCIMLQRHCYVKSGDPEFNICHNIGDLKEIEVSAIRVMKTAVRNCQNLSNLVLLICVTAKKRANEISSAQLIEELFPNFWAVKLTP
jgi:hypothetical protein